jgi:hypothetical protein
MSYRWLIKKIPTSKYEMLAERFMDALLEAKEGGNVPSSLVKAILYYSAQDHLASETSLVTLLEALASVDPQLTVSILEEFGLEEVDLPQKPAE